MYPKNIQEYIVERIIKHNKYRDEEMRKLYKVLEDFDILKCDVCLEYSQNVKSCDMCDFKCCETCYDTKIRHIDTWNLSGCKMCEKCILIYCHFCIAEVGTNGRTCTICDSILCEKCTLRWPKCCEK